MSIIGNKNEKAPSLQNVGFFYVKNYFLTSGEKFNILKENKNAPRIAERLMLGQAVALTVQETIIKIFNEMSP